MGASNNGLGFGSTASPKEGRLAGLEKANRARRASNPDQPQQITRIPPYRPGMWVKVKEFDSRELGSDLSGKVRRVKSLTCSITSPDQKAAVWRVHFEDGRCLEWHLVERMATEAEVRTAQARRLSYGALSARGR